MTSPDRFATLDELRAKHSELIAQVGRHLIGGTNPDGVRTFVDKAIATGAVLDADADRAAAQALIGYWTARVSAARREPGGSVLPDFDDTVLAAYDPSTLVAAVAAATQTLDSLTPHDQRLARRIFQRIVRLRPNAAGVAESGMAAVDAEPASAPPGAMVTATLPFSWATSPPPRVSPELWGAFDSVTTARSVLHDVSTSDKVDAIITAFVAAGVLRVTPGDTPTADLIALRSPDLLRLWPPLHAWMIDRLRLRAKAEAWRQWMAIPSQARGWRERYLRKMLDFGNAVEAARRWLFRRFPILDILPNTTSHMLEGPELDDFQRLIDQSDLEREYVRASRFDALLMTQRNRLLLAIAVALISFAAVGWAVAARSAYHARAKSDEANEKQKDLHAREQLSTLRLLVRALADIVNSRDDATRELAIARWNELARAAKQQSFEVLRAEDLDMLRDQAIAGNRPAREGYLPGLAIEKIAEARSKLEVRPEVIQALAAAREVAFAMVRLSATRAVDNLKAGEAVSKVEPYLEEFFEQYWGEMLLVEDPNVRSAMVMFGQDLNSIRQQKQSRTRDALVCELETHLKQLTDALDQQSQSPIPFR